MALGPITNRLSGLRERLSRWTEAHSHGFSKDPTVPTIVLNKTNTKPSLVQPRRSPAGSGHFGTAEMTTCQSSTLLPAHEPASPAIAPPALPGFSLRPRTSPALFPIPLRQTSENVTRSSKAHLRCAGLVLVCLSTLVGTVGSLEKPCSPFASVQRESLSRSPESRFVIGPSATAHLNG